MEVEMEINIVTIRFNLKGHMLEHVCVQHPSNFLQSLYSTNFLLFILDIDECTTPNKYGTLGNATCCVNTCVDQIDGFTCNCPQGKVGIHCCSSKDISICDINYTTSFYVLFLSFAKF